MSLVSTFKSKRSKYEKWEATFSDPCFRSVFNCASSNLTASLSTENPMTQISSNEIRHSIGNSKDKTTADLNHK